MCEKSDDIQDETDEPSDLFWSFPRASCHENLLKLGNAATLPQLGRECWLLGRSRRGTPVAARTRGLGSALSRDRDAPQSVPRRSSLYRSYGCGGANMRQNEIRVNDAADAEVTDAVKNVECR
jgi:hypothetical protein